MKHLLIGGAAVAALAIAAPVWAQPAPSAPPPGTSAPGPAAPSAMPNQMNRMPAGGRATSERGSGRCARITRAMPDTRRGTRPPVTKPTN